MPVNRYVLFLLLAIGGAVLDLTTKSVVFGEHFEPELWFRGIRQPRTWWIDGMFGIECSTNPGALFGIGRGYSFVFACISFVAIGGILAWLFWFKQAIDRWINVALGLITGGIVGNLYDRLGLGYQASYPEEIKDNVRDWILFQWEGGWKLFDPWPNFNIADCMLVTGAIMLFLHAVIYPDPSNLDKQAKNQNGQEGGDPAE